MATVCTEDERLMAISFMDGITLSPDSDYEDATGFMRIALDYNNASGCWPDLVDFSDGYSIICDWIRSCYEYEHDWGGEWDAEWAEQKTALISKYAQARLDWIFDNYDKEDIMEFINNQLSDNAVFETNISGCLENCFKFSNEVDQTMWSVWAKGRE